MNEIDLQSGLSELNIILQEKDIVIGFVSEITPKEFNII